MGAYRCVTHYTHRMTEAQEQAGLLALMATLERGLGGTNLHPGLSALPEARVSAAPVVVLLVIDGMGELRLSEHAPGLLRHRLCSLASVFPSATAPAVTTLLTAAAPAAHAVLGWHFEARELDEVVTFLPFRARGGGPLSGDPAELLGTTTLCERVTRPDQLDCVLGSPSDISDSKVSRLFAGPARRVSFTTLPGMVEVLEIAAREAPARRFVYGYWSWLDTISHVHGTDAPRTVAHLCQLAEAIEVLAERLRRVGALLLVTADHGFVDCDRVVDAGQHPELLACLRRPLCGEPRVAFCHVREDARVRFERYVTDALADDVELLHPQALLAAGVFGPGPVDPRARARLGDYVLRCRGRSVLIDRLATEKPFQQIGVHGGVLPEETRVPLLAFS